MTTTEIEDLLIEVLDDNYIMDQFTNSMIKHTQLMRSRYDLLNHRNKCMINNDFDRVLLVIAAMLAISGLLFISWGIWV